MRLSPGSCPLPQPSATDIPTFLKMILEDPKPSPTERDLLLPPNSSSGPSNGAGTTNPHLSSSSTPSSPRSSSSSSSDDPPAYTPPPEEDILRRRSYRRSRLRKIGNFLVVAAVLVALSVLFHAGRRAWERGSDGSDQGRTKPSPSSPLSSSAPSASSTPKRPPLEDGRSEEEKLGRR